MLRRLARTVVPGLKVPWARWSRNWAGVPDQVVDLRSDTVTRPGPAMRRAMAEAVVGDDDYGEDPTVLGEPGEQARGRGRCGDPRGAVRGADGRTAWTQSCASLHLRTHLQARWCTLRPCSFSGRNLNCRRRLQSCLGWNRPCLCQRTPWPTSSLIAGVHSQPLPDMPHGTLDLNELERALTRGFGNSYHPVCELVCLENTHSSAGGRVLPIDYLRQVRLLAHTYGARIHLDGARLMNAAVALRVPPARLVEHCDSVSFCFSKGLGAPVGALVGGAKGFIEEAWRLRKALGGGMRQAGVLAAAAMVGLAEAEEVLPRDHENARRFAKGLRDLASPVCSVDPDTVETNMVLVQVAGLPPAELCQRLQAVSAEEVAQTGRAVSVLLFPWTEQAVRIVWHRDVSAQDTELALRKWEFVLRQLRP